MKPSLLELVLAFLRALSQFFDTLARAARQLAHEITGAMFVVFVLIGALSTWRGWQQSSPGWVLAVSVGFTMFMGFFAVTAFWKARKVGK
ncbi:MAG: hypothetical protein ACRD5F_05245 [Candidatus Acidiferrales bacterium]